MVMSDNKCPVCGQGGIKDYKTEHIVCPQCNSDLKPYLILDEISKVNIKNKLWITFLGSLMLVGFLLSGFLILKNSNMKEKISENIVTHSLLQDSIKKLNSFVSDSSNMLNKSIIIKYVVKRGDYPWKIAESFYGEGKQYLQIEKENNLTPPYTLKVGQVLKIKLIEK